MKSIIYFPIAIPGIICYLITNKDAQSKIKMDVAAYWERTRGKLNKPVAFRHWYMLYTSNREFRNVYYCRLGLMGKILPVFLKPLPSLFINPSLCKNYDGGLYIAHGTSVRVGAERIGRNLWMHQNVTIGMIGEGRPSIGDNVYIGTGAVILGGITIGNNVRIGANATVVDDVPDNAVVVSPKAKVVKILTQQNEKAQHGAVGGGKHIDIQLIKRSIICAISISSCRWQAKEAGSAMRDGQHPNRSSNSKGNPSSSALSRA